YFYRAQTGEFLSVIVRGTDDFDPIVEIVDAGGRVIVSNDDYMFPDSRDALIEGFVAPTSGRYEIRVRGYNGSDGDYTLTILPGYSNLITEETFADDSNWIAISTDPVDEATFFSVEEQGVLSQDGFNRSGLAMGVMPEGATYYLHTTMTNIDSNQGWRAGIIFGYQDVSDYYRLLVNYRGAWQITRVLSGEAIVVRDWSIHPQIPPNNTAFSLGILVNGTTFDVFYNGQFIGRSESDTFITGEAGLVAETIDVIQGNAVVSFDNFVITRPTLVNEQPIIPTSIVGNGTNATVRELEQRLLVPTGGDMRLVLSESFVTNTQVGVSRFAVGEPATNFAVGTRVWWATDETAINGCGLVVRDDENNNYVLAFVDSAGGSGLSERMGDAFAQNVFETDNVVAPPHDLVVIVRDEAVYYFLNGQLRGTLEMAIRQGNIAEASISFDGSSASCQFTDTWIWQWE
ncbi:MAG: hypothetical protein AAFN11_17805, partial [Chloroflexota bacterium]